MTCLQGSDRPRGAVASGGRLDEQESFGTSPSLLTTCKVSVRPVRPSTRCQSLALPHRQPTRSSLDTCSATSKSAFVVKFHVLLISLPKLGTLSTAGTALSGWGNVLLTRRSRGCGPRLPRWSVEYEGESSGAPSSTASRSSSAARDGPACLHDDVPAQATVPSRGRSSPAPSNTDRLSISSTSPLLLLPPPSSPPSASASASTRKHPYTQLNPYRPSLSAPPPHARHPCPIQRPSSPLSSRPHARTARSPRASTSSLRTRTCIISPGASATPHRLSQDINDHGWRAHLPRHGPHAHRLCGPSCVLHNAM